ncbi:MAG: hypothetical protein QOH35_3652, partial [Acidobacteriaceae bacterium]|nr:hypothetical protein [Acidobacteriaceae bacterium]
LKLLLQHPEEFIFAVKTAIGPIHRVCFPFQLMGLDGAQRNAVFASEIARIALLRPCQAGRIRNDCEHLRSKHSLGCVSQVGRVHPTGIGHNYALERAQSRMEGLFFFLEADGLSEVGFRAVGLGHE